MSKKKKKRGREREREKEKDFEGYANSDDINVRKILLLDQIKMKRFKELLSVAR